MEIRTQHKKGFNLVEVILSMGLFAIMVMGLVGAVVYGRQTSMITGKNAHAEFLAEEGLEAARNIRDENIANLTDGDHGLAISGGRWNFSGTTDTVGEYTRKLTISTVDQNTKKAVSEVSWLPDINNSDRTAKVLLETYLTNWQAPVGGGKLAYGEGTVNTPRVRDWDGGTFSSEASTLAAGSTIRHVIIEASPTSDEMLLGIQTTGGNLYIQRWNGSAWLNEWSATVGDGNLARFDIAYEQTSGHALVVYSVNATTTITYKTWNGSSWSNALNQPTQRTVGIIDGFKLESQPASDNIAVAWCDRNLDLSANFWDGSNNVWKTEPSAVLAANLSKVGAATTPNIQSFDLAFESQSGELLVVWGLDATADPRYVTRGSGASGTWSSVGTATILFEEPTDLDLAADPNSNYIAYANATDNGGDADVAIWNGSSWQYQYNFDTSIDTVSAGTKNVSVNWVSANGHDRAVVTYDDTNAAGVDWLFFNRDTNGWVTNADFSTAPAPAGADDKLHRSYINPQNKGELILLVVDNNSDLYTKKLSFDGTNLTWSHAEPGGVVIENSISSITGLSAGFTFKKNAQ